MLGLTRRSLSRSLACLVALGGMSVADAQQPPPKASPASPNATVTVDGRVALASLISLGDGHLRKLADFLHVLAASDAARSGNWTRVRGPLADVAQRNVPATLWFALPDGSYWTVTGGRATETLATRAYFPKVIAGHTVIGDLVVSKSSGKSVAIVAVPVRDAGGTVIGALGSSVYLDSLSLRLAREMNLPDNVIFYSIDSQPIGALNRDVKLIFTEPLKLGPDLSRAIREIMASEEGVTSYEFLNTRRTVLFRKSALTGWRYALGLATPMRRSSP